MMFKKLFSKTTHKSTNQDLGTVPFPYEQDAFYQNPYPYYENLRRNHPIYSSPDGLTVLSREEDISYALNHPSLGNAPSRFSSLSANKVEKSLCAEVAHNILPFIDGKKHKEQRRYVAQAFNKAYKLHKTALSAKVQAGVSDLPEQWNILKDFATPLASDYILTILGLPQEDALADWARSFFYLFTNIPSIDVKEQMEEHFSEFRAWLRGIIESQEYSEGFVSILLNDTSNYSLTINELCDITLLFYADGLENVDSGIANMIYLLSKEASALEEVRGDPGLVTNVVEECLRLEPPAQYIMRTCLEDFIWNGEQFKKDHNVILLLASALRDEAKYENPESFLLHREPDSSLSFGKGSHSCLGAHLVRDLMQIIVERIASSKRTIIVTEPVKWQTRKGHRWPEDFKVSLL